MNDELQALKDMNVYELIQLQHVPSECHVLRHTWVYKIKVMPDGTIARYKARICVDGSQQRKGLDFEETWAPVASAVSIRLVISLAVHYNMSLINMTLNWLLFLRLLTDPCTWCRPLDPRHLRILYGG